MALCLATLSLMMSQGLPWQIAQPAAAAEELVPESPASPQLCDAVDGFTIVRGMTDWSEGFSLEALEALDQLVDAPGANAAAYRDFSALAENPESVPTLEQAEQVSSRFAAAFDRDVATCAK